QQCAFVSFQDYKGQKLAEQIFQGIILVSAVIGFIYGFITEQFGWTVYIVLAGFAVSCLVSLHNKALQYTAYLSLLLALGTFDRELSSSEEGLKAHGLAAVHP
ncbi:UNVERIFIED_CONTAM: hypothetical protein FKN15_019073, partial [Acipenser sinensis]